MFYFMIDLYNCQGHYVYITGRLFLELFLSGLNLNTVFLPDLQPLFMEYACFLIFRSVNLDSLELLVWLVGPQFVDVFHENFLVLKHVPLGL